MLLTLEAFDTTGPLLINIREGQALRLYDGLRILRAHVFADQFELLPREAELRESARRAWTMERRR
jgi:hypothetical protein